MKKVELYLSDDGGVFPDAAEYVYDAEDDFFIQFGFDASDPDDEIIHFGVTFQYVKTVTCDKVIKLYYKYS